MRRVGLVLLLFYGVLAGRAATSSDCLKVDGSAILAKHLAQVDPSWQAAPEDFRIGYTPSPGSRRVFSVAFLSRLASRLQLPSTPSRSICIELATYPLEDHKILQVMKDELAANGLHDAEIQLVDFSRTEVPAGELHFPIESLRSPPSTNPEQPVLWKGYVEYGQSRRLPIWARVRISSRQRVVVAVAELHPGQPVSPELLQLRTIETFPLLDRTLVQEPEEIAGAMPYRRIAAGIPLEKQWFRRPVAVRRGDIVQVVARVGGAVLKLDARADSTAEIGQFVRLVNPSSGQKFVARVVGPQKALVELPGESHHAESAGRR